MKTTLKIVCMYCNTDMGEKDGEGVEGTSHSVCDKCLKEQLVKLPSPPTKTCEVCGHTGTNVHEWPTYKDGRDKTEYQCNDYEACLSRKHNKKPANTITWAEARCPICKLMFSYIKDGYKPATCSKFACVQEYLHPELRNK